MKSVATRRFWNSSTPCPLKRAETRRKELSPVEENPSHPSLHFRRLQGNDDRFTVRIGDHHRAIARMASETAVWVWIGTHAEYDKLVGR